MLPGSVIVKQQGGGVFTHCPPSRYLRLLAALFLAGYFLAFWAGLVDPGFNRWMVQTSLRYGLVAGRVITIDTRGCIWDGAISRCQK